MSSYLRIEGISLCVLKWNITDVKLTEESDFTVSGGSSDTVSLASGANDTTWKIQPNAELGVGPHTGTITVTYKAENSAIDRTATAQVSLTVDKATATVTKPKGKTELTYTGKEQDLIEAGSVSEGPGTMKYSLTGGDDYSTEIPKGKDVGSYTVYWKVDGADETNYDYGEVGTSGTVTVTIGQAEADVKPTQNSISYDYGTDGGITLEVTVAPKNSAGIALASAEQNQVEFVFPKGTPKTVSVDAGGGKVSVTIDADEVKNYFKAGAENTVTVNYGGSDNLKPVASTTITVTVNPKTLNFTFKATDRPYDGTTTVTGTLSEPELVGTDTVTAKYTANMNDADVGNGKNVNVTVTLEGADKDFYTAANPEDVTVNISKAPSQVTKEPTGNTLTYSGSEQELINAGTAAGGTMKYYLGTANPGTEAEGWTNDASTIKGTDAKTYTIWYYVAGDENHNDTTPASVTATISKAPSSVTNPPTATNPTYTGNAQELVTEGGEVTGGTLKYALGSDSAPTSAYGTEIPKGTNAGTYHVWYMVEGDKDHENTTPAKVDVTIAQATSSVTVSASENPTYGSNITLTATVTAGEIDKGNITGEVRFKVDGAELGEAVEVTGGTATLTIGADDGDLQKKLFGENGTTNVTAEYTGNTNIAENTSTEKEVNVQRKELTFSFTAHEKTYNGDTTVTGTLSGPIGLVGSDTVESSCTASAESADVGDRVKVTVTVTITGANAKYYTVKNPTDVTVKIVKAAVTDTTAPTPKAGLIYNGADQELIQTEGSAAGGTMKYYVGEKGVSAKPDGEVEWKNAADIKGKDAGTYTVWYKVVGDGNHNDTDPASITVNIAQKEVMLEWHGHENLTYTGSPQNVTATAATGVDGESVNVTVTGGNQTNAGSYEAEAAGLTDGKEGQASNYKLPTNVKQSYTIQKAPVTFTVTENKVTYDTRSHTAKVTQTESESPRLTGSDFSVTYGPDKTANKTNAGEYDVYVTLSNNNFKFDGEGDDTREKKLTEKMTVNQAELTLDVTGAEITYGDLLSTSKLEGEATINGDTKITGSFAWDTGDGAKYPTVTTDSENTEYKVIFTPDAQYKGNFTDASLTTTINIKINPYPLTPLVDSVEGKTYDGTAAVPDTPTLKFQENLDIAPFDTNKPTASGTFEFVDENVGTNKHVNVTEITLDNSTDYTLKAETINNAETNAEVTAKTVTLTWQDHENLSYDKNAKNVTATTEDFVAGDAVSLSYTDNDKTNVGTYTAKAGLTGDDAKNYTISNNSREYTITPAPVSFAVGSENKAEWPTTETNDDPNPDGYKLTGSGTNYALEMTYDSYTHTANVAQTAGEPVSIVSADFNGYRVTYKKDGVETPNVRDAGTYEIWVTINPVSSSEDVRNYVFSSHESETSLKIGEITIAPYTVRVTWTHLKYVYHAHSMHPTITVQNAFKKDLYTGTVLPDNFDTNAPDAYNGYKVIPFAATDGSDVGEYEVTVRLYGQNAGNYKVEDDTETVTIVPAPVTFTVADNIWVIKDDGTLSRSTLTLKPAWGAVTVDPDVAVHENYPASGTKIESDLQYEIEYRRGGETFTNPTDPGTYEVWVKIGNENFRHTATSDGAFHNVGELIITDDPGSIKTYTVKFDPGFEGAAGGPADMTGVFANQTVVLPALDVTRENFIFQGWSCGGRTYLPNEEFHMPASDVTFKAEWLDKENTRHVEGTVLQERTGGEPKALFGATVTLKQGSNEIGETSTDGDGKFSFEDLTPGIYNLEIRYNDGSAEVVKTFLVDVENDSSLDGTYTLPEGALNTVVEADVTAVVDMESIVEEASADGIYTPDDAEIVEDGGTVEFKMSIHSTTLEPEQLEEIPVPEDRIGMTLDLELTKTVTHSGGDDVITIDDSKVPITTVIHLPPELQGKSGYTIYRFHDTDGDGKAEMQTITTSHNSEDEYLRLIREGTAIEIHARLYSTYVLTWAQRSGGGSSGFAVTLPENVDHGGITANYRNAVQDSTVTLTVRPDSGYVLGELTVSDSAGKAVTLTDHGDGTYSFKMPACDVTVKVVFKCDGGEACPSRRFTDLDMKAWYHEYTDYVIANGLMHGVGGNLFDPNGTVTRAQMVTVLWNISGDPVVNYYMTYSDVSEDMWCAEAIRWATSEMIVDGYGSGKFGPNDPITREQMAVMLYRYEQKYGGGGFVGDWQYKLPFTDTAKISSWAYEAVAWCNMKGVVTGKDGSVFDPAGNARRSEIAAVLTRYCRNSVKKALT